MTAVALWLVVKLFAGCFLFLAWWIGMLRPMGERIRKNQLGSLTPWIIRGMGLAVLTILFAVFCSWELAYREVESPPPAGDRSVPESAPRAERPATRESLDEKSARLQAEAAAEAAEAKRRYEEIK